MVRTKKKINFNQLILAISFFILALSIGYYLVIYIPKKESGFNLNLGVPTDLVPTVKLTDTPIVTIPSSNNAVQSIKKDEVERINNQIEFWLKQHKDEIEFEKTLIENVKNCELLMKEGKVDYRACEIMLKSVEDSHKSVEEISEKIDKLELQRATIISGM